MSKEIHVENCPKCGEYIGCHVIFTESGTSVAIATFASRNTTVDGNGVTCMCGFNVVPIEDFPPVEQAVETGDPPMTCQHPEDRSSQNPIYGLPYTEEERIAAEKAFAASPLGPHALPREGDALTFQHDGDPTP